MNLAQRSISSAAWNAGANVARVVILFLRSVFLARLLPVETFGTYTLALSIVTLTGVLASFGLGQALIHRAPETADEPTAAAAHFTLKLMLTCIWAAALLIGAYVFAIGELQTAIITLTLIYGGIHLAATPQVLLVRRVAHKRLAAIDLTVAIVSTIVAVTLAWRGATLGALLATDLVVLVVLLVALYSWRPVWRPRLLWRPDIFRYYFNFGGRHLVGRLLSVTIDRADEIWTGAILGQTALGYYSRAYTFATYPRRVLAAPVNRVAVGTFAELKNDRLHLSQAFFRVNALLIRGGFLFGGLLVLVAPEFIRLLLGEKWLPMLGAFQLMLIFTILEPIRVTVSTLFSAVGHPERVIRTLVFQLVLLLAGLVTLGNRWGINGVALAVDFMLVVGLVLLLRQAREFVDFSAGRLFVVPSLALAAALFAALASQWLVCTRMSLGGVCSSDLATGALKTLPFLTVFILIELVAERDQLEIYTREIIKALKAPKGRIST